MSEYKDASVGPKITFRPHDKDDFGRALVPGTNCLVIIEDEKSGLAVQFVTERWLGDAITAFIEKQK